MPVICANSPHGAGQTHEIPDGARRIEIRPLAVNWGDDDLRADWQGSYVFCSFACLGDWADERADLHDTNVVREGV